MRILAFLLPAIALAGCSAQPTTEELHARARAATAEAVTGVAADAIEIANLQKSVAKSMWEARTPTGVYACSSDERFALPDCKPVS